ncbi:MAG: hypothetical protein HOV80_09840 [Polyangiaceae bacterium]|nr:hypothetical protein [Polyangiaceae bacterium]
MKSRFALSIGSMLVVGCSAGESPEDGTGGSGTDTGASSSSTGAFQGTGGGNHEDCAAGTEFIYLIGQDGQLIRFDPENVAFSPIGVLSCPNGDSPFSMTIARDGYAWVEYSNMRLYRVDIATAACTPTDYVPNQVGFQRFGMGMVAASPESEETLYVADFDGVGIAKLDRQTLQLTFVGAFDQIFGAAELTGTADGRLVGFFPSESPAVIAEIDPASGSILSVIPQPVTAGFGWAFAFWGGDFYMFTAPDGNMSRVDRYRPSDGTTTFLVNVPTVIVGAGVSTCAPLVPPA